MRCAPSVSEVDQNCTAHPRGKDVPTSESAAVRSTGHGAEPRSGDGDSTSVRPHATFLRRGRWVLEIRTSAPTGTAATTSSTTCWTSGTSGDRPARRGRHDPCPGNPEPVPVQPGPAGSHRSLRSLSTAGRPPGHATGGELTVKPRHGLPRSKDFTDSDPVRRRPADPERRQRVHPHRRRRRW